MSKKTRLTTWRRDMVLALTCEGKTNPAISDKLHVPMRTVIRDIAYWDNLLTNNNGLLDKRILWECEKGIVTYDTVISYMSDIMKDTSQESRDRISAANAISNATDRRVALIRSKDTLKRTVKLITTLKQRTDLPQGSIVQNGKVSIVAEERTEETRTLTGPVNNN